MYLLLKIRSIRLNTENFWYNCVRKYGNTERTPKKTMKFTVGKKCKLKYSTKTIIAKKGRIDKTKN